MFRRERTARHVLRMAGWLASAAAAAGAVQTGQAQQAATLNGPPVQIQPYVSEPGVPNVTIPTGTLTQPSSAGDGTTGDGTGSGGSTNTGSSDALNTMIGTPWGAQAAADAQALGLNPSALAATCVLESGCGANTSSTGSAQGVFQMQPAAYQEGLNTALAANPALASQIVQGSAGMNDPVTEAIAASGYLMQASNSLESAGITDPTVLDARGYYNFGPKYADAVASAPDSAPMAQVLAGASSNVFTGNNITPGETVGQWRASVSATIGNAAGQSVMT